ncbi:uncharacterized protein LOC107862435 isoform X1 [Capsicum annuum]|uniref:uncharacterized protein LOC107862435 isoform X1 n=2 Tax=Capsicum annuum TaxID=4072 RepID=UPI0007BFB0E3|nr:uncharacterized protein LOC107862435 isoform X1 [Capsicum annuum]
MLMLRGCWFLHVNIGIMWYKLIVRRLLCAISFSISLTLQILKAKRFLAPVTALRILEQVIDTVIPLSSAMFHPLFQPEVQKQCLNDPGSASINYLEFSNSPIYSPSVQDFSIDLCNFEGCTRSTTPIYFRRGMEAGKDWQRWNSPPLFEQGKSKHCERFSDSI